MTGVDVENLCRAEEEWTWLARYITRNPAPLDETPWDAEDRSAEPLRYQVAPILRRASETAKGQVWLNRMKGALRQHRHRSPANGRETCTFALASETKKKLQQLAKRYRRSEISVIESLITDADRDDASYRQKLVRQKAKDKFTQHQTNDALTECRAELAETKRHLNATVRLLAAYESARGEAPLLSEEQLNQSSELSLQKIERINGEIAHSVLLRIEMTPVIQEMRIRRLGKPRTL